MDTLHAEQMGFIVYALLFAIFYSERLLYLAFCGALAVVGGHTLLEYAPALFIPVELVVSIARIFRRGFGRVL